MSKLFFVVFLAVSLALLVWVLVFHLIASLVREYKTRKAIAYGQRLIAAVHEQIDRAEYERRNFDNFHNVIDARNRFH